MENIKTPRIKLKEANEQIKNLKWKLTKTEMELKHVLQDMPVSPFTYTVSPDTSSVDAMEQHKITEEIKKSKILIPSLKTPLLLMKKL